jgi:hypothetical protein
MATAPQRKAPTEGEQPLKRRIDFPEPQTAPRPLPAAQHKPRNPSPPPPTARPRPSPIVTAAALKDGIFNHSEEEEEKEEEQKERALNPPAKVSSFRYDDIGDEDEIAKLASIFAIHDDYAPSDDSADDLFDFGDDPTPSLPTGDKPLRLKFSGDETKPQTPPQHSAIDRKQVIDEEEDNIEAPAAAMKQSTRDKQEAGEEEDDELDVFAVGSDDHCKQKVDEEEDGNTGIDDDLPEQKSPLSTSDVVKKGTSKQPKANKEEEEEEEDHNDTLASDLPADVSGQEVSKDIETHSLILKALSDDDQTPGQDDHLNAPKEEPPAADDDEPDVSGASELLRMSDDVVQKSEEEITEDAIMATKSEILVDELATDSLPVVNEGEEVAQEPNREEEDQEEETLEEEEAAELEELLVEIWALAQEGENSEDGPPADPLGLVLSGQKWDKSRVDFEIKVVFDLADRICAGQLEKVLCGRE